MRKSKKTKEQLEQEAYALVMRAETTDKQNEKSSLLLGYKIGFRACEAKYKAAAKAQSA